MATIIPTTVEQQIQAAAYRWTDYSTADTSVPVKVQNMQGLAGSVQVTGTFGGATITLQVSNDGTNYATLKDGVGSDITFSAAGMREFSTAALYLKPTSTGGTADNVVVTVILAAATASTDYATAAQGALADTAVQPADDAADLGSGAATDGYVLTADGAGGAAWEAASGGGGTPGGSDTQLQFNDGGAFGGDSGFTFDKTNNTLNVTGATITASDPIIDMAQTWNNGAVAFTAVKANVTDTASAAGSLLMDLQVGGVSRTRVDKNGSLRLSLPTGLGTIPLVETGGYGLYYVPANVAIALTSGDIQLAEFWRNTEPKVRFNSSISIGGSADTILARDAANTLAQRNGVNAQAFNLYNTYTDASNYERGFMRFVSNVLQIGAEAAGTGTGRNISISPGGAGTQIVSVAMTGFQAFDLRYGGTPFINFQKYAGGGTTGWVTNASDIHYRWTPSGTALAEGDVGIKRDAAGVLKITNGNNAASGTGKLIFIVPTTDPGITGALWNNLGVLSISA